VKSGQDPRRAGDPVTCGGAFR